MECFAKNKACLSLKCSVIFTLPGNVYLCESPQKSSLEIRIPCIPARWQQCLNLVGDINLKLHYVYVVAEWVFAGRFGWILVP